MTTPAIDINIEQLIEKLITNPPENPKTFNLEFENFENVKNIFEFCMEFFIKLSVAKYGNGKGKIDITTWTTHTIQTIGEYFASFGFKFNIIITELNDPNMPIYNSMRHDVIQITPQTHLSNIVYMLKQAGKVYIISFDYI